MTRQWPSPSLRQIVVKREMTLPSGVAREAGGDRVAAVGGGGDGVGRPGERCLRRP